MKNQTDFRSLGTLEPIIRDRVNFPESEFDGDFYLNPDYRDLVVRDDAKPAAVLIGLIERREGVHVILTKRTEKLASHSGQISFPGGKVDESDGSVEETALREAQEEIGLDPGEVSVLGRMPNYFTGSRYKITPIVASVSPDAKFEISEDEVDYMFEVPLAFLMDANNHIKASRVFQGNERFYLEMPYQGHYIWGVTAGIIRVMHDRVFSI